MSDNPIQVGGAYVENEDHIPNPTDMVAQYNTSGIGAHGKIEEVSPIFETDKVQTAAEIVAALDPENKTVSSDRVLLPETIEDNETARNTLLEAAKSRLEQGVVVGGPTPAEREAELEGDEGVLAAVEQERSNAAANSTGNRNAGQHEGSVSSNEGKDDTALAGARQARGQSSDGGSDDDGSKSGDGDGDDGSSKSGDGDDGSDGGGSKGSDEDPQPGTESYYDSLKGERLEEALTERDLPHTGTADEKRDRVREYDEAED